MLMTRSRALAMGLAAFLLSAPALAQLPPPKLDPVAQEAQQLFMEGREAVKKGELGRAVALFLRSQELHPTVGTLLNLASVEEQLGKIASAMEHFELAGKELKEDDDRLPVAREGAARLKPRVPTLRIERAAGAPATMGIRVDGAALAASQVGAERRLDPGTYNVTTEAPGHEERRYQVKLIEGAHETLAVEVGKPVTLLLPPSGTAPRSSSVTTAGWALGGVGLAGLGVGAVAGILAIGKKSDAAAQCPNPASCGSAGLESAAAGRALAGVSTAGFVLGGLGVAAGVTLIVVGRPRAASAPQQAVSARVSPWALPGGAGIGAAGSF